SCPAGKGACGWSGGPAEMPLLFPSRTTIASPVAHGVLVHAKAFGQFVHGIYPVQLHPVGIDPAGRHRPYSGPATRRRIESAFTSVRRPSLNASSRPSAIIA
ncbi:hypothetical protein OY671_012181, partial [Metschnikowia pulcherrima]